MEHDQQKSRDLPNLNSFLGFHYVHREKIWRSIIYSENLQMNEILVKLAVNKIVGFFNTKEEVKIF